MGPLAKQSRYLPAEDTELLIRALRGSRGGSCLEIGFGSGAVVSSVAKRFDLAAATDLIDIEQGAMAKADGVDLVISDRARCFRDASFDLVFSNPPYLPSESVDDRAVDGGLGGVEVPARFVQEAKRVLKRDGEIFILLSDRGDLSGFKSQCESIGLSAETIATRKLFYEELVVFRLEKRPVKAKRSSTRRRNR
jgi:release factor glutamine methyltransferase